MCIALTSLFKRYNNIIQDTVIDALHSSLRHLKMNLGKRKTNMLHSKS